MELSDQFDALLKQAGVVVIGFGPDGSLKEGADVLAGLTGFDSEELLGEGWIEKLLPDELRPKVDELLGLNGELDSTECNLELNTKDGLRKALQCQLAYQLDARGNLEEILAVGVDITERRTVERELQRNNELLEKLFDQIPVMITMYRPDIQMVQVNKAFERLIGWSREEVSQVDIMEVCYPDSEYREMVRDFMVSLDKGWRDFDVTAKDGTIVESSWTNIALSDDTHIGIGIDVRERKQAERERERLLNRLRVAIKNSGIVVFEQDRDLRYTWITNPHTKYTNGDVLGKSDYELFPEQDADRLTGIKRQVLESGDKARQEVRITIDGVPHYYELVVEPLYDRNQEIEGILCSSADVTYRKQVEETLRDINQELEERVRERTRELQEEINERQRAEAELAETQRRLMDSVEAERKLLARELHDGPMQEIYAVIYSLAVLDANDPKDEIEEDLNRVQERLKEINKSLRATTRHLRPPSLAAFGLEKSIREHVASLQLDLRDMDIHLNLMSDGTALSEDVRLALFRIYQIAITNVIRHAQATEVEIDFRFDDEFIVLVIKDIGRGFETPDRLIDFARRGHLGLLGAYERARAIGGELKIRSQPDQGTSVRVVVPR